MARLQWKCACPLGVCKSNDLSGKYLFKDAACHFFWQIAEMDDQDAAAKGLYALSNLAGAHLRNVRSG